MMPASAADDSSNSSSTATTSSRTKPSFFFGLPRPRLPSFFFGLPRLRLPSFSWLFPRPFASASNSSPPSPSSPRSQRSPPSLRSPRSLTRSASTASLASSLSATRSRSRAPSRHPPRPRPPDFDADYADPRHIEAFAKALSEDPSDPQEKVHHIVAVSDFAPINEKTRRNRKRPAEDERAGFAHKLLRFPLLSVIFLVISIQFFFYVFVRQIVNVVEWTIAWRGQKGKLRKRLRRAESYDEWRKAASKLDWYQGYDEWKREEQSGLYDWILVKKVLGSLRTYREQDDAENLLGVLDLCVRSNFAGIEGFQLYSQTYWGTKDMIEQYIDEVERSLAYITATPKLPLEAKRQFFRAISKTYGRSALCLSGGATFAYYSFGVVRALLDLDLLPRVITGTSAGSLVAALACTRTNDELKQILIPELAEKITACEDPFTVWWPRFLKTGARFDTVSWVAKSAYFTHGSLTFKEAFQRTGRVLNVSVIPNDRHSPAKLLNYLTAPDCVIWSALLASAAVPGILNPVPLIQKRLDGSVVPWNMAHRFKDGSLRSDIPLQALQSLFNVNFAFVSQTNPHVHLFFFAPTGTPGRPVAHRQGKGWRGGFVLSAAEQILKLSLSTHFKIIRDLQLLPQLLGQDWSSVFLQPFGGAVTIWPKTRFWDWIRILSDPDVKELDRMISVGQKVTWPKAHMIENRMRIEVAIAQGRTVVRRAIRGRHLSSRSGSKLARDSSEETLAAAATRAEGANANLTDTDFGSEVEGSPTGGRSGAAGLILEKGGKKKWSADDLRERLLHKRVAGSNSGGSSPQMGHMREDAGDLESPPSSKEWSS